MGDVFLKLLNMSIAASWLILAVLLLRLLFRKIPKWVNCLLWGIVAVRLICPFSIEFEYSLIPSAETIKSNTTVTGEVQSYIPVIDSKSAIVEDTINPILSEAFAYNEYESVAPLQVFTYIAGIIWCSGMVLLSVYAIVSGLRILHMVKEAVRYEKNIYICDAVKFPFILGIIRPRIYLSSDANMEEMNYIIAHEQAHLKRRDHWWKLLGYLLLSIYWFCPLCWVAYFLFCKDIELACDEKVIRDMSLSEKKEYSKTLLSCSRQGRMVMAYPLAFGEVGVKERVKAVLNYKKTAFGLLAAAISVCIIAAVCFLTNPPEEYQIRVTIPAGSTEAFSYSDEEICPKSGTLTLYAGEGLGDTEIKLLPVEVKEENAYDGPTYITPGMPVKMEVEKGAWFKIGVNVQNSSEESRNVYVSVENVEVRIASTENSKEPEEGDEVDDVPGQEAEQSIEQAPVKEEILQKEITGEENSASDNLAVASITVTNGNNGDKISFSRLDSGNAFRDLLQLYEQLNFSADTEANSRIGYKYIMTLYNEKGEVIHTVTPYKDGFSMDSTFYMYDGSDGYDQESVELMNYMDLLFYPASVLYDHEEQMKNTVGRQIVLPGNSNWIKDVRYYYTSDSSMEIHYYDRILESDCVLQVVRDGALVLPDISFDNSLEENWQGHSASNQPVVIKVQRSEDGKKVFATWQYEDCEFAIETTVSDKDADINAVPKAAICIIENLD